MRNLNVREPEPRPLFPVCFQSVNGDKNCFYIKDDIINVQNTRIGRGNRGPGSQNLKPEVIPRSFKIKKKNLCMTGNLFAVAESLINQCM
jgi:hypothetical protein